MKRREFLKLSLAAGAGIVFAACNSKSGAKQAEENVHYLQPEVGKVTSLEGKIIHVCPVDKSKMKLRLADGEIVRVFNADYTPFDYNLWNGKTVRIKGKLEEMAVTREYIATNYKEKKLLCHIDHTPCTDIKWIENHWKRGSAQEILDRDNKNLQMKMHATKQNHVQVFSILTEEIELA